jgi:hypothetical protein
MNLSFDHLVHFVNSPLQAVTEMNQLGLYTLAGGNHENWGTYNSLSYFGLSYIEFLGIRDRKKAEEAATHNDLIRQATSILPNDQGFSRLALRTNNIEEVTHHIQNLGLKTQGPIHGERRRGDGETIRWKMLFIKDDKNGLPLPFIIQWNQSDEDRQRDLQEKIDAHPLGNVEIQDLVFAVHDVQETSEKWSRMFGLKSSDVYYEVDLQALSIQLQLKGGNLIICSPQGSGIVAKQLVKHGEGPFLLRLKGEESISKQEILGSYFQIKEQER